MKVHDDFRDRRVVLTGGSSGIGRRLAVRLAEAGVFLLARRRGPLLRDAMVPGSGPLGDRLRGAFRQRRRDEGGVAMNDRDSGAIPDFAIIGSGVSGGRIAYELTAAGARCLLLEAGSWFDASSYPGNEMDASARMYWGGGIELSADGALGFLRGKCVGGGSVVNQAILDRFDDDAWDDWRARAGLPFLSGREMSRHYDAVERELSLATIPPHHFNRNTRLFVESFERRGFGWTPFRRGQADCGLDRGSDCIVCLGGCPRDSKQSALVTTLRRARAQGLRIWSEVEARHLAFSRGLVRIIGTRNGAPIEVKAARVVLSAGALGNAAILLRSGLGMRLPALGRGFTCHPQFFVYGLFDEPVNAHKGAFQAVRSDDAAFRRQGIKFESNFAPPIATAMLLPGSGRPHLGLMKGYRNLASMEVAIRDEPTGRLRLGRGGKLIIDKSLTASDRRKARAGVAVIRDLLSTAGARRVVACKQSFALHLMGGCALGDDPARSVVGPDFRVHGCPNVYAADSSVFPSAPGINPSLTIMAMSRKAARTIVGKE
jgi:choline dehydrogenase-like flavoprotein